ncbi:MAG: shikimate dehydrogenase [Anaerolineales bacterium]|nr:shikimate dehydrogenase [Anaerolineales bacterium]
MTISAKTTVVGLLGWPIGHSFSPAMHNAAAAAAGLDLVYVGFPVQPARVEAAVNGLAALGLRGVNVTVPHKQAVMPHLDTIDPAAAAIGAVNTILVDAETGRTSGFNTDWRGFLADLRWDPAGLDVLVLGAGGSARAIAYALAQTARRVTVLARRPEQAEALVATLTPYLDRPVLAAGDLATAGAYPAELIINCTAAGMHPHEGTTPWPAGAAFPAKVRLYDLVYNPAETELMRQVAAAGGAVQGGLGMLIHQGAEAFHIWTGVTPDVAVMMAAVRRAECLADSK